MKVAVVADSHDYMTNIKKLVKAVNDLGIKYMLHCGDIVAPFTIKAFGEYKGEFYGCFGNNDGERAGLVKAFAKIGTVHTDPYRLKLEGYSILLTHKPDLAREAAENGGYDLVAFGHEHKVIVDRELSLMVCPGEVCGWTTGKATWALVDIEEQTVKIMKI